MKFMIIFFAAFLFLTAAEISYGQSAWRPFNSDSPWNTKIPADAKTDPDSETLIDSFAVGGLYININDWSIPVYSSELYCFASCRRFQRQSSLHNRHFKNDRVGHVGGTEK